VKLYNFRSKCRLEDFTLLVHVNKRVKNKLYDDLDIDNPYLQNQPKGRIDRFKDFVKRIIK